MSNNRDLFVRGLEEVKAQVGRIPLQLYGYLPQAVEAMMKPFARAMRRELLQHRRGGFLRKSITTRNTFYEVNNVAFGVVGPDRAFTGRWQGKLARPSKYAHLLQYGTKPHFLSRLKTGLRETVVVQAKDGYNFRKPYTRTRDVYQGYGRMHPGAKPFPFRDNAEAAARAESIRLGVLVLTRAVASVNLKESA